MDEPEFIEVKAEKVTVEEIKQVVIETTDRRKQATLFHLIEKHRPFLERSEQMKKQSVLNVVDRTEVRVEGFLQVENHMMVKKFKNFNKR